jgi:hypothetical protein
MGTAAIHTKAIGKHGVVYAFGTLPASKALRVEVALARAIGETLAELGTGSLDQAMAAARGSEGGADAGAEDAAKEALAKALMRLLSSLAVDDWQTPDGRKMMGLGSLMKTMFEHVTVGGQPLDLDVHFTGRTRDKYIVLAEALRFNFADFFTGASAGTGGHHAEKAA